jgi:prolyl-tRNA editing enzyme YbaK/EbsC (Cys-tRNA(Pro) deacylase)
LQRYFTTLGLKAEAVAHKRVYTAFDLAQTTGVKLEGIAKSLLVTVTPHYGEQKSKYVIAVLPASHHLDLNALKRYLKVRRVALPKEGVMAKFFRVRAGALTAFGPLHRRTPVVLDRALLKAKRVLARSGSFTDSVFLSARDLLRATAGEVATVARRARRR